MSKKIWSVKFKSSPLSEIKTTKNSPMTRSKALAAAREIAEKHVQWHVWVERSHGLGMNYAKGERIWEYVHGMIFIK